MARVLSYSIKPSSYSQSNINALYHTATLTLADQASLLISPAFGDLRITSQVAQQKDLHPADSLVPATKGVYGNAHS